MTSSPPYPINSSTKLIAQAQAKARASEGRELPTQNPTPIDPTLLNLTPHTQHRTVADRHLTHRMGIADFFSDLYSSMGFPEAHADAPPKEEDDASNEEGSDEGKGEGEGDEKEEGGDEEGGDEEGGEEEEEEEEEEPSDPKPKLEEGEFLSGNRAISGHNRLTLIFLLQIVSDPRSAQAGSTTTTSASSA
jgi:hypothetical protein